tara:strand:- start:48 stop:176 length:129 start_codon:yes stop_codon:yes gene_type:complete
MKYYYYTVTWASTTIPSNPFDCPYTDIYPLNVEDIVVEIHHA